MKAQDHSLYWDFMDEEVLPPDELTEENDGVWRHAIERADAGDNSLLTELIKMRLPLTARACRWMVDLLQRTQFTPTKSGAQTVPAYTATEAQIRARFWRYLVDRYIKEGKAAKDTGAAALVAGEFGVPVATVINAIRRSRTASRRRGRRPAGASNFF